MDIATVIGLVGVLGLIFWAMDSAAGIGAFIDPASVVIVFGGSIAALLMRSTLPEFINAWAKVLMKTILNSNEDPGQLIEQIVSMANISRRDGVIALEGQMGEISNPFLQTAIGMVVDGTDADTIEAKLNNDIELMAHRHGEASGVFKSWKDIAPAMGMIGTLIGLVAMLSGMDDPKAIGAGMAAALLTTLYGALIANVVFLPMADKLGARTAEETLLKTMIIQGVMSIQSGDNPRNVESKLLTFLPPSVRLTQQVRREAA